VFRQIKNQNQSDIQSAGPKAQPVLKLIPLGGVGDVTKNMYVYEYGDDQIAIDCGMGFPKDEALGVDAIIPDISYIEKSKKKFHGIILTHAHMDHIGGLPYILPRMPNVKVYGSALAIALAEIKVREFGLKNAMIPTETKLKIGPFELDFIHATHSVPNCFHILIKTPTVTVYHGADYKFDLTPLDNNPADLSAMAKAGDMGVDLMLTDCLKVDKPGFCPSERSLLKALDNEMRDTPGKFVFTTIASSISRIQMIINASARYNRKVAFVGRSIEQNVEASIKNGFIQVPKGLIVKAQQISKLPSKDVTVIVSGAQGQAGSAMHRIANDEHQMIKIKRGDRVVISSDAIPGNEGDVYELIDTLYKKNIDVVYSGTTEKIHVSGHGYAGDMQLLTRLVRPKYIVPMGGNVRHMMIYKDMAVRDMGYAEDKIVMLFGQTLLIDKSGVKDGPKVEARNVYVDGLGIGDVGTVVLRDRQVMAEDGILLAIVPFDKSTSQVSGNIEIISRGFVYQQENKDLLDDAKREVLSTLKHLKGQATDWSFIRRKIESTLEKFAFYSTKRRPLIIAILLEV
jgi:ribonuclease J